MPNWQRDLYSICVAELIAILGFGVIQPFVPYFIQDLGVTDIAQVELYSGLSISLNALTMALFAPIWGGLADRYGRKVMVERAMFGSGILFVLTAFVTDVPSFLFLRAFQGFLTGTIAAATTLVASSAPRERMGYALGSLQVAIYAGALLGPVMGGFVADAWGYRAAFHVTGALLILGGLLVLFFVREHFEPIVPTQAGQSFWRELIATVRSSVLFPVFALRLMTRIGDRTLGPILPLFVQTLLPPESRIASMTGLVLGVSAATSAVGAFFLGRVSDRAGMRSVLLLCSFGLVALYVPQFFVANVTQLMILQALAAFLMGGTLTSLSAMLAKLSPEGRQGIVYGVDTSVVSGANSFGPMLGAGIAIAFGLRPSFLFAAFLFFLAGLAVTRLVPKSASIHRSEA